MRRLSCLLPLSLWLVPVLGQTRQPIVIDHNTTDLSKIPAQWIDKAKTLVLHYAHTSHGSQIISGLAALKSDDARLDYTVYSGRADELPAASGVLRIYDGQPGETYITPELYWDSADGVAVTRAVANTKLFNFSMWSWCGQQSSNSTADVQRYLNVMNQLDTDFSAMRFILMTGHTDGGSAELTRNNNTVRTWATQNAKVLFDFADIETYDPSGKAYPQTDDACSWCANWCTTHPSDCRNLPSDCAHSHPFNCKMKARAFWWMMARLAGWDGSVSTAGSRIYANGVVNAASYEGGAVSPGEIVAVFGEGYGAESLTGLQLSSGKVGTATGGTRVLFDGEPAPMIYSLRGQVAAVVPYSVAGKSSVLVEVEHGGVKTPSVAMPVVPAKPGIFAYDASGRGQAAANNQNGTRNTAANRARVGDEMSFYLTGEGQTAPAGVDGRLAVPPYPKPQLRVTATVDGVDAEVTYAGGAPTLVAGVMQVNLKVPLTARPGEAVPVVVTVGDYATPAGITIAIQ